MAIIEKDLENNIGKAISFRYSGKFYDYAIIHKEGGYIYLLHNCYPNNNGHSNKSKYRHSYVVKTENDFYKLEDIKFIPIKSENITNYKLY